MPRTLTLTLSLSAVPLTWAGAAHADPDAAPKVDCAGSFEQSQVLRKNGQLRQAHEELLKCAQLQCKPAIRNQCSSWMEDVEATTPSLIIESTVNGEDSTDLKVSLDGTPVPDWSSSKALDIDPGEHVLQVTVPNFPPQEKKIVMREGDKRKVVAFTFGEEKHAAAPAPAGGPAPAPPPVPMHRPVPAITYVLAGAAVVGGGVFAGLAVGAKHKENSLAGDCSPNCTDQQVDDLKSRYLMANLALGVGGVAAVSALISYVVRPAVPVDEQPVQGGLVITPRSAAASALIRF